MIRKFFEMLMLPEFKNKLNQAGFWIMLSLLAGIIVGLFIAFRIYTFKMDEAIKLQGFIFKDQIYDIKQR